MRACALIPAFDAEKSVEEVTRQLVALWPEREAVFVIDDGSSDRTSVVAARAGARVVRHEQNRGKGAALRTGLKLAEELGFDVAVTVDADGQHPPDEAVRLLTIDAERVALVLGVRDLVSAGAPRTNQISNAISNFFLSLFSWRTLADTQCGLRRYPVSETLALGGEDDGYAFEAEIILRAIAGGVPIVEEPVRVFYPRERERVTHFDSVRDPARIIARVVRTLVTTRGLRKPPESERPTAAAPPKRDDRGRDSASPLSPPPGVSAP